MSTGVELWDSQTAGSWSDLLFVGAELWDSQTAVSCVGRLAHEHWSRTVGQPDNCELE